MTGYALCVSGEVSDQAMWDDARWESRVDKGAGVYCIQNRGRGRQRTGADEDHRKSWHLRYLLPPLQCPASKWRKRREAEEEKDKE